MKANVLFDYVDLCKKEGTEPTWEGCREYEKTKKEA